MNRQSIDGIASAVASAMIWGFSPMIAILVLNQGISPTMSAVLRAIIHIPFSWYIMIRLVPKEKRQLSRIQWRDISIIAVVQTGTSLLLYYCYDMIGAGLTTALNYCYPLLVAVIGALLYKEKVSPVAAVCILLSVAGVALCCDLQGNLNMLGVVLSIVSGFTFAFYLVYMSKSSVGSLPNIVILFYYNLLMIPLLFLYAICIGELDFDITAKGWLFAAVLSLFNTLGGSFLMQRAVQLIGPQKTAIFSTMDPLIAVLSASFFLKEAITVRNYFGIAVILTSVFLLTCYEYRQSKREALQ